MVYNYYSRTGLSCHSLFVLSLNAFIYHLAHTTSVHTFFVSFVWFNLIMLAAVFEFWIESSQNIDKILQVSPTSFSNITI